jgi:hypothetical protein
MTRFAVVGHVEWIEFGTFDHVPEPGEIIDADEWSPRPRAAPPWSPSSSPSSTATWTSSPRSATTSAAAGRTSA